MQFKPSAGIFVSGLLMSILGSVFGFVGMGIASSGSYYDSGSSAGGGFLAFLGFATALVGTILVYVGATRALKIVDALPAVLNFAAYEQARYAPAPPPAQQFQQPAPQQPQHQPYTPPQTPQHLVYNEPRAEQQPPV